MRVPYFRVKKLQKACSKNVNFFLKKVSMGVKKSQILCRFQFRRNCSEIMHWKKLNPPKKFFCDFDRLFLGKQFLRIIFYSTYFMNNFFRSEISINSDFFCPYRPISVLKKSQTYESPLLSDKVSLPCPFKFVCQCPNNCNKLSTRQ